MFLETIIWLVYGNYVKKGAVGYIMMYEGRLRSF